MWTHCHRCSWCSAASEVLGSGHKCVFISVKGVYVFLFALREYVHTQVEVTFCLLHYAVYVKKNARCVLYNVVSCAFWAETYIYIYITALLSASFCSHAVQRSHEEINIFKSFCFVFRSLKFSRFAQTWKHQDSWRGSDADAVWLCLFQKCQDSPYRL